MSTRLTPWFPGDVAPVRSGVYERIINGYRKYSYWNGSFWKSSRSTIKNAKAERIASFFQPDSFADEFKWRGVTYGLTTLEA